jgi:epidermal growth factor receptor substrate 15
MARAFVPSPEELALTDAILAQADAQILGIITGDVAVRVFTGAKLPPTVLGEIWNIADEENHGWLSRKGVAIAVRLIGHAQRGEKVTRSLLNNREAFISCALFR